MKNQFLIAVVLFAVSLAPAAELAYDGQYIDDIWEQHLSLDPKEALGDLSDEGFLWGETFQVSLETSAGTSWNGVVTVSFGRDVNEDGELGVEETALVLVFTPGIGQYNWNALPLPWNGYSWPHWGSGGVLPSIWCHEKTFQVESASHDYRANLNGQVFDDVWYFEYQGNGVQMMKLTYIIDGTAFFVPQNTDPSFPNFRLSYWDDYFGQEVENSFHPSNWNLIRVKGVGNLLKLNMTLDWVSYY